MSSNMPGISIARQDKDSGIITLRNPAAVDNITIDYDDSSSGSSVKSLNKKNPLPPIIKKQLPDETGGLTKQREDNSRQHVNKASAPRDREGIENMEYFSNNNKHKPLEEHIPSRTNYEEDDASDEYYEDDYDNDNDEYDDMGYNENPINDNCEEDPQELEFKKRDLLLKLSALEKKGVKLTKKMNTSNSYSDIQYEYESQKKELSIDAGIKFQRKTMLAIITGLEFLNNKFDPIGAKLDGWAESINDSIGDYDDIFRKLYEKYSKKTELPPEIELIFTIVASGVMFHITNTFLKPNMGELFSNNPDILKNISSALNGGGNPPNDPRDKENDKRSKDMSGPSLNLSSFMNMKTPDLSNTPPFPKSTCIKSINKNSDKNDDDKFSVASSASLPVSSVSKSGKKTVTLM